MTFRFSKIKIFFSGNQKIFGNAGDAGENPENAGDMAVFFHAGEIIDMQSSPTALFGVDAEYGVCQFFTLKASAKFVSKSVKNRKVETSLILTYYILLERSRKTI